VNLLENTVDLGIRGHSGFNGHEKKEEGKNHRCGRGQVRKVGGPVGPADLSDWLMEILRLERKVRQCGTVANLIGWTSVLILPTRVHFISELHRRLRMSRT
jgi:hypothetical protein